MTMKNCRECSREISSKADKCPHCGAKVPKKTSWVVWLVLVITVFIVVNKIREPDAPSTQPAAVIIPKPEKPNPVKQLKFNFQVTLGGFGNTMLLKNVTIYNPTTTPMKDPLIRCSLYAASGTHLGNTDFTVYQPLKAKGKITVQEINMGFVNSQAAEASCRIVNAITH